MQDKYKIIVYFRDKKREFTITKLSGLGLVPIDRMVVSSTRPGPCFVVAKLETEHVNDSDLSFYFI